MSLQTSSQDLTLKATELVKKGMFQAALDFIISNQHELESNAEAHYIRAVCFRRLKQQDAAVGALEMVLSIEPNYVRAYQELGHVLNDQGKVSSATKAYETAVLADNALIASWTALINLYSKSGNKTGLDRAKHEVAQLSALHPALQAVKSHINRDNLSMADQICRDYMLQNKQDIEGMRLLAEIATRAKMLEEAEFILESAVVFSPNHIGARFDYANLLLKRQKFGTAHSIANLLNQQNPQQVQFQVLLAATLSGVGETQASASLYRDIIKRNSGSQSLFLLLGHAEKTLGNIDAATNAYQQLYKQSPSFGDAFWSLANTKTYRFSDHEIDHMQDYSNRSDTSLTDKVHMNFALGKALEDRQDYDSAFRAYQLGNQLNRDLLEYDIPEIQKRVQRQISICNADLFSVLSDVGCEHPDPIFIVGLPRAGSTLLEQILASHSQVDGTMELPNILSISRRLRGREKLAKGEEPRYPKILAELEHDYFRQFGEQYINDTKVFRQGAPLFIDKMPNNFLHIGLIKLILPNAKIIDARRHPMACCFSGFKQLFAEGQEFTYGLQEIGDYYKNYVELMDHWDKVLPGFVLTVQHEDVVHDLETQVRRILDFCGLPFEENCIEFYKTKRNVRTPSSEQVRQPIYTTGLEQWRNFEEHLQPLIDALGPELLERYPIA
ncbi:MAG: tetratricopeptide (TPR) repeat protein [Arenicella sp.]|jgi:tetratricopeptide (TPR) repeat protein